MINSVKVETSIYNLRTNEESRFWNLSEMKGNVFGKILFLIRNKPSIIRRFPRKINEHKYTSTVNLDE